MTFPVSPPEGEFSVEQARAAGRQLAAHAAARRARELPGGQMDVYDCIAEVERANA